MVTDQFLFRYTQPEFATHKRDNILVDESGQINEYGRSRKLLAILIRIWRRRPVQAMSSIWLFLNEHFWHRVYSDSMFFMRLNEFWFHALWMNPCHREWLRNIIWLGNICNAYRLHTPIRRIRLQIAKKTSDMANLSEALANFSRNYGIWILAKFLNLFFPRKMVVTKERCLPSREAHPKTHDIPARDTGSQERYLW